MYKTDRKMTTTWTRRRGADSFPQGIPLYPLGYQPRHMALLFRDGLFTTSAAIPIQSSTKHLFVTVTFHERQISMIISLDIIPLNSQLSSSFALGKLFPSRIEIMSDNVHGQVSEHISRQTETF